MAAARTVRLALLLGGGALLAGALLTTAHWPRDAALNPPLAAPERPVETAAASVTSLVCTAPAYDAGLQRVGATVAHTFTVRNAGKRDFLIAAVKTSCGCTTAASRQRSIRPGETVGIETQLSLSNPGKIAAAILVFGQDSDQPPLRLQFLGEALADPVALTLNRETHLDLGELAFGSQAIGISSCPIPRRQPGRSPMPPRTSLSPSNV